MADDEKSSKWGWLLTTAKVVGAVATIGGVIVAVSAWVFSAVMAERDDKIHDLQADIETLNETITRLSSQLDDSREQFVDIRIAVELLNARLELRTAPSGTTPSVRVRVRPAPPPATVPTSVHTPSLSDPPPLGRPFPTLPGLSPPPEERVFHTDREAEMAFEEAIGGVGGEL